uniref:rRNA N-glycosylase n=1 Tax=Leersia perrieri TaxID=77586 RepID=A0A0D9VW68_9ORYZ
MVFDFIGREGRKIRACYRTDNWYMIGFANGRGDWFAFKGLKHLIPGSTELDIIDSYSANGIGDLKYLQKLPLSRRHALDAVDNLFPYDRFDTPRDVLQMSVSTLILLTSETGRFRRLYNPVAAEWDNEDGIIIEDLQFLRFFGKISCELIVGWDTIFSGDIVQEIGLILNINSKQEAMEYLHLVVLRGRYCEDDEDFVGFEPLNPPNHEPGPQN